MPRPVNYNMLRGVWTQEDIDFIMTAPEVPEPAKALISDLLLFYSEN